MKNTSLTSCTIGAIALRPSVNFQGSYVFYSLDSGRKIVRNKGTCLPMSSKVIDRAHTLAHDDVATLENELSNSLEMNDHGDPAEEIYTNKITTVDNSPESINDHIGVRNDNQNEIFDNSDEGTRNIEPVENDRDELRNENKIDNEQINNNNQNNMINNISDECDRQSNKGRLLTLTLTQT
jgi:hypothetical protein